MAFSFLTPGYNPAVVSPAAVGYGNLLDYQDPSAAGMLAAGAALLQAGAPSTTPRGFGGAVGPALAGYLAGTQGAQRGNLQSRLLAGQLGQLEAATAKQRADAERAAALRRLLMGGTANTSPAAMAEAVTPGAAFEADAFARSGGTVGAPYQPSQATANQMRGVPVPPSQGVTGAVQRPYAVSDAGTLLVKGADGGMSVPVGQAGGAMPGASAAAMPPVVGGLPMQQLLALLPDDQIAPALMSLAAKDNQPIVAGPGTAVLDRRTMRPIFTNPKTDRPTDTQTLLEAAGYKPGTPEYEGAARSLISAKLKPLVSIDMGHKADEEILKADIGQLKEAREGAAAEVPVRQRLQIMVDQLLSGTQTGPISEATLPLKNMIVESGLASADQAAKWGDQELFRATSAYLVPRMRVPGSGASSDRDLAEFKASLPGLSKSPQANLIIGASMLQLQDHNATRVRLMDAWMREKKSLKGFGEYADKEMGALFPTVKEEDVGNLRPGTVYKGTDGKYRVRRNMGIGS